MDSHSILDPGSGALAARDESAGPTPGPQQEQDNVRFPGEDGGKSLAEMAERDLSATLQLLAERAQYITGATGAAIALRDHEEMVCRASAGASAPEVGAQLQVNSGLSGESVRTRQTLRCDDASTDERVNRESCEALGIRSVVVMPLQRGDDVIGVFELFSDQANIFAARDITALERMGAMVHTALEHSAAALGLQPPAKDQATIPSLPIPSNGHGRGYEEDAFIADAPFVSPAPKLTVSSSSTGEPSLADSSPAVQGSAAASASGPAGIVFHRKPSGTAAAPATAEVAVPSSSGPDLDETALDEPVLELSIAEGLEAPSLPATVSALSDSTEDVLDDAVLAPLPMTPVATASLAPIPPQAREASPSAGSAEPGAPAAQGPLANLRRCESCGFPVSEGRQLCLDCEKKSAAKSGTATDPPASAATAVGQSPMVSEPPRFFSGEEPEASWLSSHKMMVIALVVAVIAIAIVVLLR